MRAVELPEQPIVCHADPLRLGQVLSNLLTNAIKYTPPRGAIALKAWLEALPGTYVHGATEAKLVVTLEADSTAEVAQLLERIRSAEVDAKRITVEANGGEVTLKGTVRSWAERQEAECAAWRAPGVVKVDNRIVISP